MSVAIIRRTSFRPIKELLSMRQIVIVLFCARCAFISARLLAGESAPPPVSFVREVAPILVAKCQACHGPTSAESNYRVDTFSALMTAGDYGTAPIEAGAVEESELHRLITADDADERMPNNGDRLSGAEVQIITTWITQGAQFDGQDENAALASQIPHDVPYPAAPQVYPAAMPVTAVALTVDGRRVIAGGYHELLVRDGESGELQARLGNLPQRVLGLAMNADGTLLAAAGGAPGVSGDLRLLSWQDDPPAEAKPTSLARLGDVFFDVAFRPDGQQLAAAAADGTIRVFDVASGAERLKIEAHADWATAVCYSADGAKIASASRDKTVKVVDAETGAVVAGYSEHNVPVRALAFAADGKSVLSAGADSVHIWNVEDAKHLGQVAGFGGEVTTLAVRGETAVAASTSGRVRHFRVADREVLREIVLESQAILSLAWHEGTHRVCAGCMDGTIVVWNLETGEMVKEFAAFPRNESTAP
jgi:WD40 repeat protein